MNFGFWNRTRKTVTSYSRHLRKTLYEFEILNNLRREKRILRFLPVFSNEAVVALPRGPRSAFREAWFHRPWGPSPAEGDSKVWTAIGHFHRWGRIEREKIDQSKLTIDYSCTFQECKKWPLFDKFTRLWRKSMPNLSSCTAFLPTLRLQKTST